MLKRVLLLVIFLIPLSSASQEFEYNITSQITIFDNLLYNVTITYEFEKIANPFPEWTIALSDDMENVVFYDNLGTLNVKKVENISSYIFYTFNTRFLNQDEKERSSRNIHINASGSLVKLNPFFYELSFYRTTYWQPLTYNESYTVFIKYPDKIKLIGSDMEGIISSDLDKGIMNYQRPNVLTTLDFVDASKIHMIEKRIGNKVFMVENESLLLESFDLASKNFDLIPGLENSKPVQINIVNLDIGQSIFTPLDAVGLFTDSNLILIDKLLFTKEEIASTILHELTHYVYTEKDNYEGHYPLWLSEGIAVFVESRFISRTFPEHDGHMPVSLDAYFRKPNKKILQKWYDQGSTELRDLYNNTNISGGEAYSIFGFILDNYAKEYGYQNLVEAIDQGLKEIRHRERISDLFIYEESTLTNLFVQFFKSKTGFPLNIDQLFLPDKEKYDQNSELFFQSKGDLLSKPIEVEKINDILREKGLLLSPDIKRRGK